MPIRKRIIRYFASTTILLTGIVLFLIYLLFSAYREEEFQQRLKDKITFSVKFLGEIEATNKDLLDHLDQITINDLYEEKMLLFDAQKKLIYASLDDTRIQKTQEILNQLGPERTWVETKEEAFDVIGVLIQRKEQQFYGIYKAYDTFGYTQMRFLRWVLIGAFLFITLITLIVTYYLSRQITAPINQMAKEMETLNLGDRDAILSVPDTKDEINFLAQKFNEMLQRIKQAFSFQRHAVHHISHELKTPIAALVSNFEQMENLSNPDTLKKYLQQQKEDTIALGDTINALLEISKIETGNQPHMKIERIDELIYDLVDTFQMGAPDYRFKITIDPLEIREEQDLQIIANKKLLRIALNNLFNNARKYSDSSELYIHIGSHYNELKLSIQNDGPVLEAKEQEALYDYFYQGKNAEGKGGFGLGLVMVQKILELHKGNIHYQHSPEGFNEFVVTLKKNAD